MSLPKLIEEDRRNIFTQRLQQILTCRLKVISEGLHTLVYFLVKDPEQEICYVQFDFEGSVRLRISNHHPTKDLPSPTSSFYRFRK